VGRLAQQLIVEEGSLYVLNDERAAHFGINWTDLALRRLNRRIQDFLVTFLQQRAS
jgi:hypothetical protein